MAILAMQISMTGEGLEDLANSLVTRVAPTIGYFRLSSGGDTAVYNTKKADHIISTCSQYMDYKASEFATDKVATIIDLDDIGISTSDGFIAINSIELGTDANNGYFFNVEINCYIPPAVGSGFTANEIMIYTGTPAAPRSFMWGIFPEITKLDEYGLNFKAILQF